MTGRDRYLTESVKGVDAAARRRAEKVMTRLQADVDKQRAPETAIPLRQALAEWLTTTEIEASTRRTYVGYIERTIDPAVGSIAIDKLSARHLETLYAELRRCRLRCDGRPFIERHRTDDEHDCSEKKCLVHVCRPMLSAIAQHPARTTAFTSSLRKCVFEKCRRVCVASAPG